MPGKWTQEAHEAMMASERVQAAADVLLQARNKLAPLPDLDPALQPASLEEAYAVQDAMAARLGPLGGWKIGAPNPDAAPVFGPIPLRLGIAPSVAELQGARRLRGIEAELAFLLRKDLPVREKPYTRDEILGAVASVHPAIEVLESAFTAPEEATHLAMVADLQMNGGLVYGQAWESWQEQDLSSEQIEIVIDGVVRWNGRGRNTNGPDLLRLLEYLVNEAQWRTGGLEVGQWITTGSWIGKLLAMERSSVEVKFERFGNVSCRFAD